MSNISLDSVGMDEGPITPEVARRRLRAQLLGTAPAPSPEAVARHLLAVQAQDDRGARLAVRARTRGTGSVAADVDRALTEDRSLVVSWVNRGTLHLICSEDYPLLHPLTTPQLRTTCRTRLRQEGVSPEQAERGVAAIEAALTLEGPQTRAQLKEAVDRVGTPTAGQALVHTLFLATLDGLIVRGPMVGREQAFVLVRDWLADVPGAVGAGGPDFDRDAALAELARRYLVGHGPATDRDLAKWAGIALGQARRGLAGIGRDLVELDGPGELVDLARTVGRAADRAGGELSGDEQADDDAWPPPLLLGAFDALLMGWASRRPILGDDATTVTSNGVFRPFVLVGGRAVGLWRIERGKVTATPFDDPDCVDAVERNRPAIEAEADDVVRFLGIG